VSLLHKSPPQQATASCRLFVNPLISEIAGGLIFCITTEDRHSISVSLLSEELRQLLSLLEAGRFRELPTFETLPEDLLNLKGVFLTGQNEFTQCLNFAAIIKELVRIREMSRFPEFKIVLITNGMELDAPEVQLGLSHFLGSDEIWIRLNSIAFRENEELTKKILSFATKRPVVIQSAFFALHGEGPSNSEIKNYIRHLKKLKRGGALITLVQVCSPPLKDSKRDQLKLRNLSLIARRIREDSGFNTEFY
jgi:hypothetical protein